MAIPAQYGGLGLGLSALLAVMEGLGYGTRDQGLLFSINAHLWTNSIPILIHGTEDQRQRYLPGLTDGTLIGANGASEPDAGSDIFSMRTRATRDGEDYVLNGTKTFVTNAPVADLVVAYATVDPRLGATGVTAFIVERGDSGHDGQPPARQDGPAHVADGGARLRGLSRARRATGSDAKAAARRCSRARWSGSAAAFWRPVSASCGGSSRRASRTRSRESSSAAPIGKFQSVANRIVDMKVRLDTCRPLVYRIGWLKDQDRSAVQEAAIAKLYVSECFVKSSLDAVQVFGGYGYMTEQEIERDLRDAVGSTIYSGTNDIQRNIIAGSLGL